jgi:PRTRC genetic system protein B
MFRIETGSYSAEVRLQSAILLYGKEASSPIYGTVHPIELSGKDNRPTIGSGVPLDRTALVNSLALLAREAAPKSEFLPHTVLAVGPHSVTWWCAPAMRRVFFSCEELGERSAVVPHPGLVFEASHTGFRVFSLLQDDRPTPDSALYEPPYFNTWDEGKICIGSAHVPDRIDVASIVGWEKSFFNSAFTHPNHGSKRIAHRKGEYAFWKEMLDGKYGKTFPRKLLVPMNMTLGEHIASTNGVRK